MFAVTSGFLAALRSPSMVIATRVRTTSGVVLSAMSGSVSMDSRRNITRTCDLELTATTDLTTTQVYELVMTPNVEIIIERGLVVDGTPEYVPLGVFSTDTADISKSVTGSVKLNGSDRSKKVARARFTDPYRIASGTTLAAAGAALLVSRSPVITTDFTNVTETIGASITFEAGPDSDPWAAARNLFADHGYDLHFNGLGVAVATQIPDPAGTPSVFDFGAGDTNLVLGGDTRGSLENVYNGVIATGEGTEIADPVRAEAWDTNPASPTYWLGPFGRSPRFYSSPILTTTAKAQLAADTMLSKIKGRKETFSWPAIVNPALEPLDVVSLTFGTTTTKAVIDSLTIPLKAGDPMNAVARETNAA